MSGFPEHVAFILDGNRRWAKANHVPQLLGHKRGYEVVDALTRCASKYGVKYLTYYVFSMENWSRSAEEVSYLMNLFREMFDRTFKFCSENDVRIIALGNISQLPDDIAADIRNITESTKDHKSLTVSFAISYSSRDEIVRAVKNIVRDIKDQKLTSDEITESMFATYLDTKDIPDPDLIVRTKEQRLSNFLLWQAAYSEIIFLDKFWPDFDENDFRFVLDEFSKRSRRYGR